MIMVCKRCGKDIELPDGSKIRYCQKGTECYKKRMSEKVKRSVQKKKLLVYVIPENYVPPQV